MASADVLIPEKTDPPHMNDTKIQLPILRSNQGEQIEKAGTAWMQATPPDTPVDIMRKRFNDDGYLWVKNVIPRETVLDMREHYFTHLRPTGILQPDTSPRAGIFNKANDPLQHQGIGGTLESTLTTLLDEVHSSPHYRSFLATPSLRTLVRVFAGWDRETMLERAMLRHNCPGSLSTGIHYDQYFLRGGDGDFLTAWIPIGDCAANGGGLMYLEDSNALGEALETAFMEKAKMEGLTEDERRDAFNRCMNKDGFLSHDAAGFGKGKRWLVGDYEAGDVVFHKPCVVHAATRNEDREGRIRLASDVRFCDGLRKGAVDERWMGVWRHDDGL